MNAFAHARRAERNFRDLRASIGVANSVAATWLEIVGRNPDIAGQIYSVCRRLNAGDAGLERRQFCEPLVLLAANAQAAVEAVRFGFKS